MRRYVGGMVVAAAITLGACSTDDKASTGPSPVSISPALPSGPSGPGVSAGVAEGQSCGIKVTARRITSIVRGSVTILVNVDYDGDGEPYIKIIDRASGRLIKRASPGEIHVDGLEPGDYDWLIFAEVTDSNGFCQRDGGLRFTIPKLPPPPPPTCRGESCDPPPPCEPEFDKSIKTRFTEWSECRPAQSTLDLEGYRTRTRITYYFETNSCTDETVLVDTERELQRERCRLPPPPVCSIRSGPDPKQGNPQAECGFYGAQPGPAGFYICKAGQDMFASSAPFPGPNCPNGKEISHITTCSCPVS